MIELVRENAEKAHASRVGTINLVIGALSGVIGDFVQTYFDVETKGTLLEIAQLSFNVVAVTGRCRDCAHTFEIQESTWICPHCGGNHIQLVGGSELFVDSIEIE
jgi:hydrogenase nickel incorporation protein HypA/HybF